MKLVEEVQALKGQITSLEQRLSEIRRGASRGGAVSEEDLRFLDSFGDADRFWAWHDHDTDANRTIVEAGGKLTISIANGTNGNWWSTISNAPHATVGMPGQPCIIETKIESYTQNEDTMAMLVFFRNTSNATSSHIYFGCIRDAIQGYGLQCGYAGNTWQSSWGSPYNTLPMYLRIYMTSLGRGSNIQNAFSFKYSLDGSTWVDFHSDQIDNTWDTALYGLRGGLSAKNWGAFNAISAPFDYFKAWRSMGPG